MIMKFCTDVSDSQKIILTDFNDDLTSPLEVSLVLTQIR